MADDEEILITDEHRRRKADNGILAFINNQYEKYKIVVGIIGAALVIFTFVKNLPSRLTTIEQNQVVFHATIDSVQFEYEKRDRLITTQLAETNRLLAKLVRFQCKQNPKAVSAADFDCIGAEAIR